MAGKPTRNTPQKREERLKAALKANMAKRKAQARARTDTNTVEKADTQAGKDQADG